MLDGTFPRPPQPGTTAERQRAPKDPQLRRTRTSGGHFQNDAVKSSVAQQRGERIGALQRTRRRQDDPVAFTEVSNPRVVEGPNLPVGSDKHEPGHYGSVCPGPRNSGFIVGPAISSSACRAESSEPCSARSREWC